MKYYCTLEEDINSCQFFQREKGLCNGNPQCGFCVCEKEEEQKVSYNYKYVREPRWYEKYYKS